MEHELNHLCALIERQHGVIESLAGYACPATRRRLAVTLDREPLVHPLERAGPKLEAAVTRHAGPASAMVAPAGLGCFSLRHRDVPVYAVPAFGVGADDLESLIGGIAGLQAERKDFKPIFITDVPDLEPFIRRGFAVEYIPASRLDAAGRDGLLRKLRTLREKWNIEGLWDFGRDTEFFCPVCSSRKFRVAAPRSTCCAVCGGFEWHRELARWCLVWATPGTKAICPTADPAIEAIGAHLDLDIISMPATRFLSLERGDVGGAELIILCAPRNDNELREENVLPAAWHYLEQGGKIAVVYYGTSDRDEPSATSIARDLLGRWDISIHPVLSGNSQTDAIPELHLLAAAGSPQIELVTAIRKSA